MIFLFRQHIKVKAIAILSLFLCGLVNVVTASEYHFRGLTIADGLSDMLVNTIHKDSEGIIWFGSHNSIDRFDGCDIKTYPIEYNTLSPNVKISRINDIVDSPSGQLYIANNIGLWELDKTKGTLIRQFANQINELVSALYFSDDLGLLVGTESGLYIIKDGTVNLIKIEDNLFSYYNFIQEIFADSDQTIWVATQKSLSSVNPKDNYLVTTYDDKSGAGNSIHCFVKSGDDIYVGTLNNGLFYFDIKSQTYTPYIDVGCAKITDLEFDSKGALYVATDGGGVHKISTKENRVTRSFTYSPLNKISTRSNAVYSMLLDENDEMWIGYYQAGVDYTLHQNDTFKISDLSGLFDTRDISVRSFAEHENYTVVGTQNGLYLIDKERGEVEDYSTQIGSNAVLSIQFHDGLFYIGCYGMGLRILNPSTRQLQKIAIENTIFTNGIIYSLCSDGDENLWIGTSGGVFCYNPDTKSTINEFTSDNSPLPSNMVYRVFFDSEGKGWFATKNGMVLYDSDTRRVRVELFPKGFVNDEAIRYIYEDSDNNLYFLPDRGGIYRSNLDMSQIQRVDPDLGIHSDKFSFVTEDVTGHMWLGSDNGLIRTTKDWNYFSHFGFADGLTDPVFPIGAATMSKSGDLYIASNRGLFSYKSQDEILYPQLDKPLVISTTKINGEEFKDISNQRLTDKQNNIEFSFSTLAYTKPFSEVFEFWLEGHDTDWNTLSGVNKVSFYNLSSGDYKFRVRKTGNPQSEVSVDFKIRVSYSYIFAIIVIFATFILSAVSCFYIVSEQRKRISLEKSKKYNGINISSEECERLLSALNLQMSEKRLYIDANLKITDLAKVVGTSSNTLSYIFNQHLKIGYNGYVNEFRIDRFKALVADNKHSKYTLAAICEQCGFSSRTTFFRAFKKSTGITPNEYMDSIKK